MTITFATPGRHKLLANLKENVLIAGEAPGLQVHATFLRVQGPASAASGGRQRFTIVAQDDQGRPVTGYTGDLSVTTSDPNALIERPGDARGSERGAAGHRLEKANNGRIELDVTFAAGGRITSVSMTRPARKAGRRTRSA